MEQPVEQSLTVTSGCVEIKKRTRCINILTVYNKENSYVF